MIFICTCSQDVTVDLIEPYLRDAVPFRFNIDKPEDYTWDFSAGDSIISNVKTGESINSRSLSSFYLRKPMYFTAFDVPKDGCLENWCRKEVDDLFEDFYRDCEHRQLTTIVHSRNSHYGKLRQMRAASKYFKVAKWHIFHGALPAELTSGKWVAKALTGTAIGKDKVFFVKEVDPSALDLSYPWFLQEKIVGEDEVTVVFINGNIHAYRYPRTTMGDCDDVRKHTLNDFSGWTRCELTAAEQTAIRGFMDETGYRFGRFDFIRKDGELWFLELNPNGQWAWLDEDNKDGLISAIADTICSEDALHRAQHPTAESLGTDPLICRDQAFS